MRIDHPDLELAATPQLSTIVFRHREADLTDAIRASLYASGAAMVAATTVEGERWLKLTLLNPAASLEDLRAVLQRVVDAGHELADELEEAAS